MQHANRRALSQGTKTGHPQILRSPPSFLRPDILGLFNRFTRRHFPHERDVVIHEALSTILTNARAASDTNGQNRVGRTKNARVRFDRTVAVFL